MDVENHISIPSTELIQEKNTENEAINSKAEDLGPTNGRDLGGNENINSEISQREINLDKVPIVEVEMLQAREKMQVDEEPANNERESIQEGSQHTLAEELTIDQERDIDTADAPQLENEENTCMYDEQIQEVKEPHEQCKFNEMNESVSSKHKECETHGFEDDCTSKREQDEQTPMHSEASGQNVEAELPNQDNEECRIDASKVNNTEEVREHDEHGNEALIDKIKEREVINTNASSSGNELVTAGSEVTKDETLLLAEQTTEPSLGISQTNNADQGPELGVREQSLKGNEEEDELDSNKPKFNMEMVGNSIEESQHKDDREEIPLDQEENVSNVTNSCINGHDIDEKPTDETVETQGKQPVEPEENFLQPLSPSEATSTTQDKEDGSVTLKDLNKEKEEDLMPEKETQRELQVSSGFELSEDLLYIPAVEKVSKTEEYLVPEIHGANDLLDGEKMEPQGCTDSYSHKTESEADQFQTVGASLTADPSIRPNSEKYEHASEGLTENQEETKSPEQLIEPNNEEQTVEDIIEKRDRQALKSEMTVEESTVKENYESQGTPTYNTIEEKEISIETKPPEEVDNMGDDTQSSRVEELKDENAYETSGCEGDTVTNEETVFHELGLRNLSHGNKGIDTNDGDENSVPIKDNYTRMSADEVMVAEDEHHGNTQSERTSITIDAVTSEEVAASSVEIVERSSEPVPCKESKKLEEETMEEKEETNADTETHEPEFYKIDNGADRDEKTLNSTECNTKSEECSITITKDSKEISNEPNILVTSTSLEGEAVETDFQQNTSGEKAENEVRPVEPKMDASELLHQMNVLKPDNMDVEKEKQQESAKGLECFSTLTPQQGNGRIWFAEMEVPEDVSSREIDSGHPEASLKVDEIPSEGKLTNASNVHMDCQEEEKISAAEIIASHICQEIETEDKLKQSSSEHQKQIPETRTLVTDTHETSFEKETLHEESTENPFKSSDNPTEIVRAPEEREIEPPSFEAKPKALSSKFQGVETNAEVKNDTEDSTLEMLNVNEVCHLYEKRETDQSSQLSFTSQPISGENLVNSCETSTDNHTKTESFKPVIELQSEKVAIPEETGNDTQLQTVKNEIMGESSPSNFEVYEAVVTDAAEEEKMRDVKTTVVSEDRALVQSPLPTSKSCDATEKHMIADEQSANTTISVSQVSGINNTPPTGPNPLEEKVSGQPAMKRVSNQDSNITQSMQVDEEEQLRGNYDDIPQSFQLQDLCGKDSVNMRTDEPVDTNEVPSLEPMQSLTTNKEEITAEKHNETEVKSVPQSTVGNKKEEEWVVVTQNPQDDEKRAANEPKSEKEKESAGEELGEEDSELKPMISEASRDIELKTQNKKSHHILSGMGSKMKNSISKVKKAMACTSPQFSPDDVIIKLNKSKKS
ncbi:hypothetical protein KSS87_006550 [Heliosperma pusillum]|nr:hypothetical protein KSS87_006550 [Heliosperma pusillum]